MIIVNAQSSIKVKGKTTIYFDPIQIKAIHDADYIFITHTHWDHFDQETIKNIKKDSTRIIGPKDIKPICQEIGFQDEQILLVEPNKEYSIDTFHFRTLRAYNKEKSFHPKQNNWLGYLITIEKIKYYIPGDTDALEENENIKCDVAFIPIGGTYTMDAKEAAEFVNKIKPKKAIPIHYNMVIGTKEDEKVFSEYVDKNIEIEIVL